MDEAPLPYLPGETLKSARRVRRRKWWFGAHYDFTSDRIDFRVHACVRFNRVQHAYLIGPNGDPQQFDPDVTDFDELFACKSWLEAAALLRAHDA